MNFTYVSQGIPESIMKAGAVYKYDLSIPVEKMYDLVEEMRVRLGNQTNDLFFLSLMYYSILAKWLDIPCSKAGQSGM